MTSRSGGPVFSKDCSKCGRTFTRRQGNLRRAESARKWLAGVVERHEATCFGFVTVSELRKNARLLARALEQLK